MHRRKLELRKRETRSYVSLCIFFRCVLRVVLVFLCHRRNIVVSTIKLLYVLLSSLLLFCLPLSPPHIHMRQRTEEVFSASRCGVCFCFVSFLSVLTVKTLCSCACVRDGDWLYNAFYPKPFNLIICHTFTYAPTLTASYHARHWPRSSGANGVYCSVTLKDAQTCGREEPRIKPPPAIRG